MWYIILFYFIYKKKNLENKDLYEDIILTTSTFWEITHWEITLSFESPTFICRSNDTFLDPPPEKMQGVREKSTFLLLRIELKGLLFRTPCRPY